MKPEQEILIAKAKQTLAAAQLLLTNNFNDSAVSRAYYCMFYLAEAVLLEKNLVYSSHSAVISAFGREFIKENFLPSEFHRMLIAAQNDRNAGDYGGLNAITAEKASNQVKNAEQMLIEIEKFILNFP